MSVLLNYPKVKKVKKFWPLIPIFLIIFAFFAKLFFPPSVFFTPDFGRSDILHSNLPAKYTLAESLKNFSLPLWENGIGQGFPITAEGIIGTFYLPNLLIFGLLPFKIAIPVNYLVTFLISAAGMYLLLTKLKADPKEATLGAIAYTFCASMLLHVQHINFIQAASLLPLILYSLLVFLEKTQVTRGLFISFLFSQLFFTGFVQIFTYTVIIFFALIAIHYIFVLKKNFLPITASYTLIVVFSLLLSAVQLIPSYELIRQSDRQTGVDPAKILDAFPLFPPNFLTYLNPHILGDAANGTYNSTDWSKKGIYWENTAYIGLLPFILTSAALILLAQKREKNIFLAFAAVLFLTVLLSLGRFSPLHILFSFPPLNFFRVPARFILFTQFFASIMTIYFWKTIKIPKYLKKVLVLSIIVITTADIWYNWHSYNPTLKTQDLAKTPQIIESLKEKDSFRIFTIGAPKNWNRIFLESGWQGKEDYYYFFINAQDQNLNILYGVSQLSMFETLPTRRYQLQQSIIKNNINIEDNIIKVEKMVKDILDNANVKYLITASPVQGDYEQIAKLEKDDFAYFVYESKSAKEKFNFYYDYQIVSTVGDYIQKFKDLNFGKTLVLEKDPNLNLASSGNSKAVLIDQNGYLKLDVRTDEEGLLLNSQTFYPGWTAKVDGKETEIFAANINSQAIVVPKGKHEVEFIYEPKSFKIGLIISAISYFALIIIAAKKLLKAR